MANIDQHVPGSFSWIELSTSNQEGGKNFYTSLLGWTFEDSPMGPGEVYTMFHLNGRIAGAAYTMRKDEAAMGVPPHWNLYVSVADADESARKAGELGGKILAPPFDVFNYGRMAVIQDPAGAVFAIWQAKQHNGIGIQGEPGSLCWADLNTRDQQVGTKFYSELFRWKIEAGQDDSGYLHIKNGNARIGGIPPAEHQDPNAPPHWLIYLQVADCNASTEKAKQLGARIYFGPQDLPNVGRMTLLADPQGAVFSLFQPHPRLG